MLPKLSKSKSNPPNHKPAKFKQNIEKNNIYTFLIKFDKNQSIRQSMAYIV